jgi:hypothetical protein
MSAFKGPMMKQTGPINCGNEKPMDIAVRYACAGTAGTTQYVNGKWVHNDNALNGKAIETTPSA